MIKGKGPVQRQYSIYMGVKFFLTFTRCDAAGGK
jgi:hypothetical protein